MPYSEEELRERANAQARAGYDEDRKRYLRDRRRRRHKKGLCDNCGGQRLPGRRLCQRHVDLQTAKLRRVREETVARVLAAYGESCACCGESRRKFLTIDHVANDGAEHRRTFRGDFYVWLIREGFPDGFQTLCFNCNLGKARNGGVCPHQEEELRLAI